MYIIEWMNGSVKKFRSKDVWLCEIEELKSRGFHENWDFYAFND